MRALHEQDRDNYNITRLNIGGIVYYESKVLKTVTRIHFMFLSLPIQNFPTLCPQRWLSSWDRLSRFKSKACGICKASSSNQMKTLTRDSKRDMENENRKEIGASTCPACPSTTKPREMAWLYVRIKREGTATATHLLLPLAESTEDEEEKGEKQVKGEGKEKQKHVISMKQSSRLHTQGKGCNSAATLESWKSMSDIIRPFLMLC